MIAGCPWTAHHHGRLAAVGVFDARASQVQDHDHRLVAVRPLLAQDGIEALAVAAEGAERIDDAGRPVDPGDQAAAGRLRAPGEGGLDDPGQPVVGALTCLYWKLAISHPAARPALQVILADDAERLGLTGRVPRMASSRPSTAARSIAAVAQRGQRARCRPVAASTAFCFGCRSARGTRRRTRGRSARAALGIVGDVAGDQALEVLGRVPVRGGGVRRPPLWPRRSVARSADRSPNQSTVRSRCGLSQV